MSTCTVTGEADAKSRKLVRAVLRGCDAPVIVTGCVVNVDADELAGISPRICCVKDKREVPAIAARLVRAQRVDEPDPLDVARVRAGAGAFRTRVDLKIQDGCDNACSYCIVRTARGPARSMPAAEIVAQARVMAAQGVPELVLVGIDLASYDDAGLDLAGLVGMLRDRTCIPRVRISSVEPQSITPSLTGLLAASDGWLCRHLHLCLQSGSTKVLREMNRHYSAEDFSALVRSLREACPPLALSTDVIVGFPGESDEDFEQTCGIVESCGFMRLHVFKYSRRPGTPAAARADQVDPRVKAERSMALIRLGERLAREDMQRRVGTSEQVVIERPGLGTSESYHAVSCDASIPPGTLVTLELHDVDEARGRLVGR